MSIFNRVQIKRPRRRKKAWYDHNPVPRGQPIKIHFLSDKPLNYDSYLQSPYWTKIRSEVLKDHPSCKDCGTDQRLQLHHQYYYQHGRSVLYHERDFPDVFVVLCHDCHMKRHQTAET